MCKYLFSPKIMWIGNHLQSLTALPIWLLSWASVVHVTLLCTWIIIGSSQPGVTLPSLGGMDKGYRQMSEDIFNCHDRVALLASIHPVEAGDAEHFTVHGMVPETKSSQSKMSMVQS